MEAVTTFVQACSILTAHNLTVEKSSSPRLWHVGAQALNKGGVIALAAEYAAKTPSAASAAPATPPAAASPATGSSPEVPADLAAAGWALRPTGGGDWQAVDEQGNQTVPFADPADAIAAARHPHVAHSSPLPSELQLAGWQFTNATQDSSAAEAWRIENPTLGIAWTVVHTPLAHAIEIARAQQAATIGYLRPLGVEAHQPVRVDTIVPGRWQARQHFDQAALEELAASILEHGLLNPPLVFVNERLEYELVAGERRWRAAQLAGLQRIPVHVIEGTPAQLQAAAAIDNLQRADLSDIEQGREFERLITDLGISENELSKKLGKNRAYIQQRRAIATAAPEIQAALKAGQLTVSQARAIAQGAPGEFKAQLAALKDVQRKLGYGQHVTESSARQTVETEVRKRTTKQLAALGWTIDGQLVWAAGERPRYWTGAEMLEAARAARQPSTTPPAAVELTIDEGVALNRRYTVAREQNPWVRINTGWDTKTARWYAPAELAELAAAARAEWDAMVARFAAAGWTLVHKSGSFAATSPKQRTEHPYGWDAVVTLATAVEAGTAKVEPEKTQTYQAQKTKCDACGTKVEDYRYRNNQHLCRPCFAAAEEAEQQQRAALRQEIAATADSWIPHIPEAVLRALVASGASEAPDLNIPRYADAAVKAGRIRAIDVATLREAFITIVAEFAWHWHDEQLAPELAHEVGA